MPSTLSYPGVYVEEIPSGVRTITGVATSITAFVGRAKYGPVNDPVTINSFGDFERTFGGLWADSTLGFAVRDFYLNGGSQAVIVRLDKGGAAASIDLGANGETLHLLAANVGLWGNDLSVKVDHETKTPADTKLFNLTVLLPNPLDPTKTVPVEKYLNISVDPASSRFLPKVLDQEDSRLTVKKDNSGNWVVTTVRPDDGTYPASTLHTGSNGIALTSAEILGSETDKTGIYALDRTDLFNILCIPPYKDDGDIDYATVMPAAAALCERRRAFLIVDPSSSWHSKKDAKDHVGNVGTNSKNAALFFPRLRQPNPLHDNQFEDFAPCGAVAGVFARTDAQRGVWKAPAGLDATLVGVPELSVSLTDGENGELNPLGINCLRSMPAAGRVVWGARTLQGDDRLASEWKYTPIRRLALFIEESLYRGTQWVVFEPNDEPLWAQIRLNIGAFMHNLFRQGAFQGSTARDAYFVKCDKETTPQSDINLGIVNIVVGFAPLKPAEFVVIKLQQMAGQIEI
jgi:phage tail sheath protein FI